MGKIKKILENELVGGTQTTDVYPVTSVKAVYDENNERLDNIINRKGIVNISTNYNSDHIAEVLTLSQAIAKVPSKDRVLGFQGKFLTSEGWKSYMFTGDSLSNWTDITKWIEQITSAILAQELGNSPTKAISQEAVTKEINNLNTKFSELEINYNDKINIEWSDDSYYSSNLSLIPDSVNHTCSASINLEKNKLYQLKISVFADIYSGVKDSNGNIIQLFHRDVDELYNFSIISLPKDCTLYLSTLQKYKNDVILSEVNLDSLCEYINIQSGGSNIYNITNIFPNGGNGEGLYTLSQAINALPRAFIKEGTEIRFLDTAGNRKSYIYSGGEINSSSNWADLSSKLAIIPKFYLENKYYNEDLIETEYLPSKISFVENPILLKKGFSYVIYINKIRNSTYCGIKDTNNNIIWTTNASTVKHFTSSVDCYFFASCEPSGNVVIFEEGYEETGIIYDGMYYDTINNTYQNDENYEAHAIDVHPGEIWHIEVNVNGNLHNNIIAISKHPDKNKIYENPTGIYDILVGNGVNKLIINLLKGNYLSYYLSVPFNESYTQLIDKEYKEYNLSDAIKHEGQYWDKTLSLRGLSGTNAYEIAVKKGDIYVIDTLLVADLHIGYKVNNIPIEVYRGADTSIDDFRFKKFVFNFDCTLCITEYNPVKVYKKVEVDEVLTVLKDTFSPYINYPSQIVEDKSQGYYNSKGKVDTSYKPETYMHSLYKIVHTDGCSIRIYSDAVGVIGVNSAIVYFDADMNVVKTISASSLGIPNPSTTNIDYTENILGVHYIGMSTLQGASMYGILESAIIPTNKDNNKSTIAPTSNISDLGNLDVAFPEYDYNHIIVYGQSYAQGGGTVANTSNVDNTYCLGNTCSANTNKSTAELQALGNSGSQIAIQCTKSLAMLYNRGKKNKVSFIATNGGESGRQIENISKGSSYYTNLVNEMTRIKQVAETEGKSVGCVAIIFIQGESNYIANNGTGDYTDIKSEYKYLINKLKEDIQNDAISIYGQDTKPLFVTYQTGYKWIRNNNHKMTITQAQVELGLEFDDVILGCPSYQQTINDTQHPNGNGYAWIGELMAKHLYHAFVKYERYDTPHPISFSVKDNIIEIGCYVPVPPLVIDTFTSEEVTNYGFDVLKNGKSVAIKDVSVSGNRIIVTTVENIEDGIIEISYAGLNRNGEGNICDSDNRYSSFQTYADDSNDELLKYPVDINGQRIIGKKIPLQNWLCNFYQNLNFHFYNHTLKIKTTDVNIANKLFNNTGLQVTYLSSNTDVVDVDNNGVLTVKQTGHAVITASLEGQEYSDDYLLIVE